MQFFKQTSNKNCHLIALQTLLSFYNLYPSQTDLKKALPKHSFGNLITELGIYLENNSFKTRLISNKPPRLTQLLSESIQEYKQFGNFVDKIPEFKDLNNQPFIINVDWYKIKDLSKHRAPHYVVGLKENDFIWLYDGSNYTEPVKRGFENLYKASLDINRHKENGMWLLVD